jgi:hypothetical protein
MVDSLRSLIRLGEAAKRRGSTLPLLRRLNLKHVHATLTNPTPLANIWLHAKRGRRVPAQRDRLVLAPIGLCIWTMAL